MTWFQGIDLFYVGTLAVVFAGVVFLAVGARYLAGGRKNVLRDRLDRFTARPHTAAAPPAAVRRDVGGLFRATVGPLAKLATPTSAEDLGQLRVKLAQGGFRGERALLTFLALKVGFALALGLLSLWITSLYHQPLLITALITIVAMAAGFYAPSIYLASRINQQRAELNHALPSALDLLVTCVEAGLGLDAALSRVAAEIGLGSPLLAREFRQTALEMSAGIDRGEAFRRMADRTGVEEMRGLAAIIVQTQLFGTSVANSLRVQAESMRVRRMQVAEERAAAVGFKMTFPLIFCIVPALLVVLIGPGIVRFVRVLLPTLGGS